MWAFKLVLDYSLKDGRVIRGLQPCPETLSIPGDARVGGAIRDRDLTDKLREM